MSKLIEIVFSLKKVRILGTNPQTSSLLPWLSYPSPLSGPLSPRSLPPPSPVDQQGVCAGPVGGAAAGAGVPAQQEPRERKHPELQAGPEEHGELVVRSAPGLPHVGAAAARPPAGAPVRADSTSLEIQTRV